MKQYFFLLSFMLFCTATYAQNILLKDMVKLQSKDPSEVEEFLTAKKWTFSDATKSSDTTMSSIEFQYTKPNSKPFYCLFGFLYDPDKLNHSRIYFTTISSSLYQNFLNQAKADKYKFIKTNVENGTVTKVYSEYGIVLEFVTTIDKSSENPLIFYTIGLYSVYDYKTMKDKTFKN